MSVMGRNGKPNVMGKAQKAGQCAQNASNDDDGGCHRWLCFKQQQWQHRKLTRPQNKMLILPKLYIKDCGIGIARHRREQRLMCRVGRILRKIK